MNEDIRLRLQRLADIRGESVEQTAEAICANLMASVPVVIRGEHWDFSEFEGATSGREGDTPWLRTKSGRIFFDHPGDAKDALMYVLLRDRIPRGIRHDAFVVARAAAMRFVAGVDHLPPDAKVAVDAGCYVGYKAIAFADSMGDGARVVAIEMMPDNYDLLVRNVTENGLVGTVIPVHCGVSDSVGVVPVRRKRRQQATIAAADQFDARFADEGEVKTDTLANIFDRTLGPGTQVDFLNVQVNGAEIAALEGLGSWSELVQCVYVASPYTVEGSPIRERVASMLHDMGMTEIEVTENSVKAHR
jgi:FkbM family methyltransferase